MKNVYPIEVYVNGYAFYLFFLLDVSNLAHLLSE